MPDGWEQAAALLPENWRSALRAAGERFRRSEELRLRVGREPTALLNGREEVFCRGQAVRGGDLLDVLERAAASSLHSVAGELRRGFLTARGGVRIGVCGTAAEGKGVRDISSLAIRIPCQIRTAGGQLPQELARRGSSVLTLAPPGAGKTTFLRELVRCTSELGQRVSLCDERCEVAAVWDGEPQFDVGPCTDVLSAAPKAEAAMTLLRGMNPQVIALDEITAPEDIRAVESAACCGVRLYATAHAGDEADLTARPLYRQLMALGVFRCAVWIRQEGGERSYRLTEL